MEEILTVESFQRIMEMILARGDRRTYCSRYNDNPHLEVDGFHAYLSPDVGQRNIDCDPALSSFGELTIQDWSADPGVSYCSARVEGDRLVFDPRDAAALRRYFTTLLSLS